MKVNITKPAQRSLGKTGGYYGKNSPHYKKLKKDIRHKSKLLSENPEMGQEEDHLKHLNQGHRYVLVAKLYKMIYLIAAPFIFITDIFDTRQDPDKMKP
ncbi:type II toxin-antitoxin system RelE/ParE family toxin [Lewinella cohaerens]|jgi:plasmid stabilization system protein ParE|uniref:type II toxin-antitoxin system RelE/ParE family toxin n=1 Tax=Lewinella cohaerens TaxID=70995 RepID=UPI0003721946|nr:type II toxin-antitoxin system RelE/ParE family toxin [Lewinella cohaerens]